jgi:hypothetical protein
MQRMRAHVAPAPVKVIAPRGRPRALHFVDTIRDVESDARALHLAAYVVTAASPRWLAVRRFVSPFCAAIVYLGLGHKQRALDGLEKAYAARSQWMTFLKVDRIFNPLRSEPRFVELLKKVGF